MKKIIFLILPLFFITNVNALSNSCFLQTSTNLDTGVIKESCNVCDQFDDDGNKINCINQSLPLNVRVTSGSTSSSYVTGSTSDSGIANIWMRTTSPYNADFHISTTIPFSSNDLMESMTVLSSTVSGSTVKLQATIPMSFDICSTYNLVTHNTKDFVNMFFDGYDTLPTDKLGPTYFNTCKRIYVRTQAEVLYLEDNNLGAVPMERSAFWYINFGSAYDNWFQVFGDSRGGKVTAQNFQIWKFNEYVSILDNIEYRNYLTLYNNELVSIQNQNLQYLESQETYLKDIKERQEQAYTDLINSQINDEGYLGFFSNFNDIDHGGISAIVSSPIRLINSLNNYCSPVSFVIFNKNITIPCGTTIFWNRSDVTSFRNIWNILFGGAIIYGLLRKMFITIQNIKDPENDKVEVMKL